MYELNICINRCEVIAGPWQMGKIDQGFVSLWIARHLFGGDLKYIGYKGEGLQVRDILHVEDLYKLLCIQLKNMKEHRGKIYNVGGGPLQSFLNF
jgi:CDP-paratose 2-epimerase